MNTKKLKKNQVFKNYNDLCEFLGIKNTGGKYKILRLKELERFCAYHRDGYKYIIDEVYKKENVKVDRRKYGNNNEKAKCTRYLILDTLSKFNLGKDDIISFSKGQLLKQVYVINDNYLTLKNDKRKYAESIGVSLMAINECLDYFDDRTMKLITRSLKVLVDRKVLGYKYSYTWIDSDGKYHPCSSFEHNMIMNAEYEVLNEFGVNTKYFVSRADKFAVFKEKVINRIKEKNPEFFTGLSKYYISFNFHYNIKDLLEYKEYMEVEMGMTKQQSLIDLQELWKESVIKAIRTKAEKASQMKRPSEIHLYRKSDSYELEQLKIVDSLINYTAKPVNLEVEQMKLTLDDLEIPF